LTVERHGYIVTHMKTTIDISDDLLMRGKLVAKRENLTLRALIEEGLHHALKKHEEKQPFKWKPVVFKGGDGMAPEFVQGGWPAIRDTIYEGRGA
jgi:hypothetical protein